jgi:uroporphyrinogen-III synthase
VVVTRATHQAGSLEAELREAGLDPVLVPAIAVELDPPGGDVDRALLALPGFDWVVVTSPNGAQAVVTAARRGLTTLSGPRWAVVGHGTASVLRAAGVDADFQPSLPEARALADELPVAAGQRVLLLRGNLSSEELGVRLRDRGATVHDVVAYRTTEGPASSRPLLRTALASGQPAAVLFASGSAARGFASLARAERLDIAAIPAICIGPETRQAAVAVGMHVLATSPRPDPATFALTAAAALTRP